MNVKVPKKGSKFRVTSGEKILSVNPVQGDLYTVGWGDNAEDYRDYEYDAIIKNIKTGVWTVVIDKKNIHSLTVVDKENGYVTLDSALISKTWKIGSKDDSCCLSNILQTISHFDDKDNREDQIREMHQQILRLAELEEINLDEQS